MNDSPKPGPAAGRRRALRRLGVFLVLAAATGLAVAAVWGWRTIPQTTGEITLPGLAAAVDIWRDPHGIPHIRAASRNDAVFALGYVHAQDRMWQMEFTRRLGAGRLAEVLGQPALNSDRFMRTLGFNRLAALQIDMLRPETRTLIDSYAAGVNAWLEHRAEALPPEFAMLGHEPEPWRSTDSLLWGRLLGYQLSANWQTELFRARLALNLPKALLAELWPGDPPDAPITMNPGDEAALELFYGLLDEVPRSLQSHSASNAWVLGGGRTLSGKPILANDPHMAFEAPSNWYIARLITPEGELIGATAPGTPFHILGHNGVVAWGMTSTGADTQDLFIEQLDPADSLQYLAPDGPKRFRERRERIEVKDGEALDLVVRETRHGPVISDFLADMDSVAGLNSVLALADTSLAEGDRTPDALAAMATARDITSFQLAAGGFRSPVVNIFFADKEGAIGMLTPGRVPVRLAGDGSLPAGGASGRQDWAGFIPVESMPRRTDPPSGVLANANNRLVGPDYPWQIARDWDAPHRAQRILEILAARKRHSLDDTVALQNDILSDAARQLLPVMLSQVGRVEGPSIRAVELLKVWDLRMDRDRPEPLIYAAWLRETVRALAAKRLGALFPRYWRNRPAFVLSALTGNRHWCSEPDGDAMRDCGSVLRLALRRAIGRISPSLGNDISGWRWGDLHQAQFNHPLFTHTPALALLSDLSIASDGGDHTVSRGYMAAGAEGRPYRHVHGAGYKAIYDLSDLSASRFMITPGQSGNPLSRHYRDLLEPWRDGEYIAVSGDPDSFAAAGYERLALIPLAR